MKSFKSLVILVILMNYCSCLRVSYDSYVWKPEDSLGLDINGTNYSFVVKSIKNSPLGNDLRGPWKILLSTTSEQKNEYEVLEVNIRTNEGDKLVFSGNEVIPMFQIRDDGQWSGFWTIENSPVTINPSFHEGQRLEIIFRIRVNRLDQVEVIKSFRAYHLKGKETVNVLTM